MTVGLFAYFLRSKTLSVIFIFGLGLMLIGQGHYAWKASQHLPLRVVSLARHWPRLPVTARSSLQLLGNCCGYGDFADRPGEFCPSAAVVGCKYRLVEITANIKQTLKICLVLSFIVFVSMTIFTIVLSLYTAEKDQ